MAPEEDFERVGGEPVLAVVAERLGVVARPVGDPGHQRVGVVGVGGGGPGDRVGQRREPVGVVVGVGRGPGRVRDRGREAVAVVGVRRRPGRPRRGQHLAPVVVGERLAGRVRPGAGGVRRGRRRHVAGRVVPERPGRRGRVRPGSGLAGELADVVVGAGDRDPAGLGLGDRVLVGVVGEGERRVRRGGVGGGGRLDAGLLQPPAVVGVPPLAAVPVGVQGLVTRRVVPERGGDARWWRRPAGLPG